MGYYEQKSGRSAPPAGADRRGAGPEDYSHSIVAGGFDEMS